MVQVFTSVQGRTVFETYAVKWNPDYGTPVDLGVHFTRMGPLIPELIHKYTNTLKFVREKC